MPAKGKSRVTDAQRRKIAAGKVAGKTNRAIAAETKLGVRTVDRQATDPRTVTLALKLKEGCEDDFKKLYGETLRTLKRDIQAKDRNVCAMARGQFLRLLVLGDPPLLRVAPVDTSGGDYTLEELLISYRRVGPGR